MSGVSERAGDGVSELRPVPMGSQVGAEPAEHPRWDGERILPYEEGTKQPADTAA